MSVRMRLRVDLPDPDSPTTASVSPAPSANETPFRALTVAVRPKKPRLT